MPINIDDPLQQDAFERNTTTLWNLTLDFEPFAFKTLEVMRTHNKLVKFQRNIKGYNTSKTIFTYNSSLGCIRRLL